MCLFVYSQTSLARDKKTRPRVTPREGSGHGAGSRLFCFSICISYNKNINKKERKNNQQASVGDESSGYRGGRQIPSDPRFSALLEPDLNLCSEWHGQRGRALVGKAEEGWGQAVVGEMGEETGEKGEGWGLISPAILSRGLCAPPAERPRTRGKVG